MFFFLNNYKAILKFILKDSGTKLTSSQKKTKQKLKAVLFNLLDTEDFYN